MMFEYIMTYCVDLAVRVGILLAVLYFGYKLVTADYCDPDDEEIKGEKMSDLDAERIMTLIRMIVATKLNREVVSWAEVEEIYESKKYPEINAEIDYIIGGAE